jgi:ABC-type multidrug transport system fused ATPase/permease subunit
MERSMEALRDAAQTITTKLRRCGFGSRIETVNAVSAWLGSFPGHQYKEPRQLVINTANLSHMMPLSQPWRGHEFNPSKYFPRQSPSLFYATTAGGAPYRFHCHVEDVGHTLVVGPTGAGKTSLVGLGMQEAKAQWVVSDPMTETNTMMTHVTQLLQYIKDVQMALSTFQEATMMAREVQQLVTHPSTNIATDLAMFSNVLSQSQGLALNLAQMDVTFRNQFASYSPSPLVNYAAQYNTWATTALGAVRGAANSAGY